MAWVVGAGAGGASALIAARRRVGVWGGEAARPSLAGLAGLAPSSRADARADVPWPLVGCGTGALGRGRERWPGQRQAARCQ